MNRPILACAFFGLATTALVAQDQSQSSPYQGTSNPPPDDTIITSEQQAPIAKPPAGHPMQQAPQRSRSAGHRDQSRHTPGPANLRRRN